MAALTMRQAMGVLFNKSRDSEGNHISLCKKLHGIYEETQKKDLFLEIFCDMLKRILIFGQRDKVINCSIEFAVRFILSFPAVQDPETEESNWHPFVIDTFNFLLSNHDVESQAVRFRVCQFINHILDGMEERANISSNLYDKITDAMFERIMDRAPGVRLQAAIALERLQDPTNKNCGVMNVLLFHLEKDPNSEVRRAILKLIAATHASLEKILPRLQDIARNVRHQALVYLSERVHIRTLKISQRLTILRAVNSPHLDFDTQLVRDKFLRTWLECVDHSPLKLLERLDVEDSCELAVNTLHLIFTSWSCKDIVSHLNLLSEEKLIPATQLTSEIAVYWRACVEFFRDKNSAEGLDKVLPEMLDFGKLLMELYARLRESDDAVLSFSLEFIFKQLLSFTPCFDTAEEVGRANLTKTLLLFLQDSHISMSLMRPITKAYCMLEPRLETRISRLLEVIAELREPLSEADVVMDEVSDENRKMQVAQLRVKLLTAKEELNNAVSEENFDQAKTLKQQVAQLEGELSKLSVAAVCPDVEQVREEKNDPDTLIRCVSIACELLQCPKIKTLGAELHEMVNSLVLPSVQQEDPELRCVALECLGCCCTLSKDLTKQHMIIFVSALSLDCDEVKFAAVNALCDLILLFGLQSFEESGKIVELLSSQLNQREHVLMIGKSMELLMETTVEGFCKLFLARRVESAAALSRLVVALFSPGTEENLKLRQMLNVFFSSFASMSVQTQEQIEEAFQPTMKLIHKAPITSPLSEIDTASVVKFFVDTTRKNLLRRSQPDLEHKLHNKLAIQLLRDARKRPETNESRCYIKAIASLDITTSETAQLREMKDQTQRLVRNVRDKTSLKCLEKFLAFLGNFLTEEEGSPVPGASSAPKAKRTARPRSKQQLLMSKTATMLMNPIDEDEEQESPSTAQDSPDMFCSPVEPSTSKKSSIKGSKKSVKKEPRTPSIVVASSSSSSTPPIIVIDDSDEDFVKETTPPKRTLRSAKKKK